MLYKQTPEPKFDIALDGDGNSVSTPATQSPFTLELIEEARKNEHVMGQLQSFRADDFKRHREVIHKIGPELEQKYGVSAREIFLKGDSKAASRLHSASKDAYGWLREYSRFL